ncbi:rod shape-determining protein MreC [Candidatus Dependentiae bacterium]|nr:rod shape-determining protein MreC [Candidatus Dependentiae bacterium]
MIYPKNIKLTYFLTFICLFLFLFNKYISNGTLQSYFSKAAYPFLLVQNFASQKIKIFFEEKKAYKELYKDHQTALNEIENLKSENVKLNALINFENQTKEIIEFTKQYEAQNYLFAQVIFKNLTIDNHFFLVDIGSQKGAHVDMAVIYKNFLVGRISEVFPYWSKVTLITDKSCKVSALSSRSHVHGICEGQCTNQISLNFVSHLDDIKLDDLILSSGQGLIFPQGFSIGKVTYCEIKGLNYEVKLQPLVDFEKIDYCYLIQKGQN